MQPILQHLHSKVIPWTAGNAEPRFIVARAEMEAARLPRGATLSPRPRQGRRVIVKGRRKHANQRLHIADWPDDNLQEIAPPKLACVVSGVADYLLENCCLHCPEGTFIFIPPHAPHHDDGPFLDASRPPDSTCTLLFAHAYSHGVYFWFSHSIGARHVNSKVNNYLIRDAAAAQLLRLLMEDANAARANWETACNSLLHAFFVILAREIAAGNYTHPGPKENREASTDGARGFGTELSEYIEANFNRPVKLADAAAQMFLSCPQFCRRVRQETGTTFIELLTRYRIERAQELLRETDWTASAIASHVGFQSASYFQNLFRRRVGSTPTAYRHQKR